MPLIPVLHVNMRVGRKSPPKRASYVLPRSAALGRVAGAAGRLTCRLRRRARLRRSTRCTYPIRGGATSHRHKAVARAVHPLGLWSSRPCPDDLRSIHLNLGFDLCPPPIESDPPMGQYWAMRCRVIDILRLIWCTLADFFRSRADLQTKIIALRHQPTPSRQNRHSRQAMSRNCGHVRPSTLSAKSRSCIRPKIAQFFDLAGRSSGGCRFRQERRP